MCVKIIPLLLRHCSEFYYILEVRFCLLNVMCTDVIGAKRDVMRTKRDVRRTKSDIMRMENVVMRPENDVF